MRKPEHTRFYEELYGSESKGSERLKRLSQEREEARKELKEELKERDKKC